MEYYIGQLLCGCFDFAPKGWLLCNGQLLKINAYQALYALLGTRYGGDGVTTFALPDLRGRMPIHFGQGPGLSNYTQGESAGVEEVTLQVTEMPLHNHPAACGSHATTNDPANAMPAVLTDPSGQITVQGYSQSGGKTMWAGAIQPVGGNLAHENRSPYLVLNWCIAVEGVFPSRG